MKPTISYNGNVSVSTVTNKLDVLSANEFMNFIKNKSGLEGADWEASDYYKNMGYWSAYNADGTPADGAQHLLLIQIGKMRFTARPLLPTITSR